MTRPLGKGAQVIIITVLHLFDFYLPIFFVFEKQREKGRESSILWFTPWISATRRWLSLEQGTQCGSPVRVASPVPALEPGGSGMGAGPPTSTLITVPNRCPCLS